MKRIAIIGATGMLGKPVTQQLIAAGFSVKLLGRNTKKMKQLFPTAAVAEADLKSLESLRLSLADCDTIYLNLSVKQDEKAADWHTESDGLDNLLQAAKELDIQRIVYLSSIVKDYQGMNGFDWWVFRIKNEAVEKIKTSGISYYIFYPSTFFESFELQIMGKNIAMVGTSNEKMWFIGATNYGKQVVAALRQDNLASDEFVVQGTEAFTYQEANEMFIKNYPHARLGILTMPIWVAKFGGIFSQKMNYLFHIMTALNNYPERFEAEQTWKKLGKPEQTLAVFAQNYKK